MPAPLKAGPVIVVVIIGGIVTVVTESANRRSVYTYEGFRAAVCPRSLPSVRGAEAAEEPRAAQPPSLPARRRLPRSLSSAMLSGRSLDAPRIRMRARFCGFRKPRSRERESFRSSGVAPEDESTRARARARDEGNYHPPRPLLRLFALRLSSSRKSHLPRGDVGGRCGNLLGARILRGSTRTKRAPGQGRRIHAETGASERERFHYSGVFAQRHPLRKRRATPKTNQTGRGGMRGPPGGNRRWFHARTHERRSAEVQIAPPSGLHRANGKPPQRSEGGDAAALTLCYDKYIFLFGLLIRARRYRPRERASRVIRTIDGALFGRREASRRRCGRFSARLLVSRQARARAYSN